MVSPATPSFINFIILEEPVAKEGVAGETIGFPAPEKLILVVILYKYNNKTSKTK